MGKYIYFLKTRAKQSFEGDNKKDGSQIRIFKMDEPIIFIIIGFILVVFIVSRFFTRKARIKRKLKKAELKKMASFKNGDLAKIVGTVEIIGTPLVAPLSGRECSVYTIHIEERIRSGKSTRWKTRVKEEVSCKYVIREGKHCAYINDKNVNSYIVQDRNYSSGFMNEATENLKRYLNLKGYNSEGILGFNRTFRFKEGVLENGEKIAVFGKGEWKDAANFELPEIYDKVLEITSSNKEAVFLSDDTDTTKERTIKKKARVKDYDIEKRYRK